MAEPGRITDQIVNAIETADLIVADLTGNNPNVMFELGYADRAGKEVVLLNQEIGATPFDIKDWRQSATTSTISAQRGPNS
jgi:nucleoside 2-deoxyribosyltransferase